MTAQMPHHLEWSHEIDALHGRSAFAFVGTLPIEPRVPDDALKASSLWRGYTTRFLVTDEGRLHVRAFEFPNAPVDIRRQVVGRDVEGDCELHLGHNFFGPRIVVPFPGGVLAPESDWVIGGQTLSGKVGRVVQEGFVVRIGFPAFLPRSLAAPETATLGEEAVGREIECEVVRRGEDAFIVREVDQS